MEFGDQVPPPPPILTIILLENCLLKICNSPLNYLLQTEQLCVCVHVCTEQRRQRLLVFLVCFQEVQCGNWLR